MSAAESDFGCDHYVPVLKVKRAEKTALMLLPAHARSRITPLLEIVERKPEVTLAKHLENAFRDLSASLEGTERCFLDAHEISPDGNSGAMAVFARAATDSISFTPVTGISRTVDVAAALLYRAQGTAIRLSRADFEAGTLQRRLLGFLGTHQLRPEDVDLIADLGPVDDMVSLGVEALADAFMADIPNQSQWRTLTLSACAFPAGLGAIERYSDGFADRIDWVALRNTAAARARQSLRVPTYSDGAIQHPIGVEGFDPVKMQVSASVRYTTGERWLLMKGESIRRRPPSAQYKDLATHLAHGHLSGNFFGASHCPGCASVRAAASGASGHGSLEAWGRIGTLHHIVCVLNDIKSSCGS